MFLKRLETIGFKSFADRVTIEFIDGITGVVGPNGSGKSNIIDAIRWVLGEQSVRSLRGQRMEDVIFQGSDTRNSLNFAEVSLVLNNENNQLKIDYQEVKVTRRVYRSGESEFLINQQACRLKDIVELFTDTGLGRESFSIIGQGKIDEILSSKAEERRAVFEEAAGVMRYKRRKDEASYKLNETENNLARVEDIIHELKQQINPLKKQAGTAKKYKEIQAELTEKQIALLVTEIEELHGQWRQLLGKIDRDKLLHVEQQTKIQTTEAHILKKQEEADEIEEAIASLQSQLLKVTEQIEKSEGKRNLLIEQQKHRNDNKAQFQIEHKNLQEELATSETEIQLEKSNLLKVEDRLKELRGEMTEIEEKLFTRQDEISDAIEELKSDYINLLNDKAVMKNESQAKESRKKQVEISLKKHEENNSNLTNEVREINEKQENLSETLDNMQQEISRRKQTLRKMNEQIQMNRKVFDEKQHNWHKINEQITKLSSRKETLDEMKKNFQGFAYGAKEILQAHKRGILKDIIGPVIELIEVPSKYIIAIDTILGMQAQYIVVPNDQIARLTIEWLKKENKGRATFLPLQSIVSRHLSSQIKSNIASEAGFIGIASELVKVESNYQAVADHLMGNVIVAKTLRDANKIAEKTNRRYRIVTLDGDLVFPGGSISGGAQRKRNASLFSREKEMDELRQELRSCEENRKQMKIKLTTLQESIDELKQGIQVKTTELTEHEERYQHLQNEERAYTIKNESLENQMAAFRFQQNEYIEEKTRLSKQIEENEAALLKIEKEILMLEDTIQMKTNEQETLLSDQRMNEQRLHSLQLENAEQQERFKNHEEKVFALNESRNSIKKKLSDIIEGLQLIKAEEKKTETVESVESAIANLREKREQITKELNGHQANRQLLLQTIEDERRELKTEQKLHEQHAATLQEKEIEANRLDVNLENHLQTLQNKYTMTYEKAAQTYEKITNIAYVSEQVNQLKSDIRALGTVNLGAIDEYERIRERESFLNEQRDDLITAKTTLYDAIQKMDEEMISRFKATFESIQAAFTLVFKQLFGGGNAELILTEPNNYLETGIDIVARPPGKKLKTLELLSGGERALTAISLLFAILRARPVPFVILDEVDAALDEANVERFASYLKQFSEDSQFVVITHRKGTMEQVDALYGVTMQESGVSRFVSVRLEETDHLMTST